MPEIQFDPEKYKQKQRKEWGETAQSRFQAHRGREEAFVQVNERLIALTRIGAGQRVLDVATGLGEPALTAAALVGPTGQVVATDLSPEMLAIATQVAAERGLSNVTFHEMDAEAPDLPARSFDAILCRFGLMYFPNPASALARLGPLLVPGGHFAAIVWGPASTVPFSRIAIQAARRVAGAAAPPPGQPNQYVLGDERVLSDLLKNAGFTEVTVEPLTITVTYASVEAYFEERMAISVPLREIVQRADEAQRGEILRAMAADLEPYRSESGGYRMDNLSLVVGGVWGT